MASKSEDYINIFQRGLWGTVKTGLSLNQFPYQNLSNHVNLQDSRCLKKKKSTYTLLAGCFFFSREINYQAFLNPSRSMTHCPEPQPHSLRQSDFQHHPTTLHPLQK